jgi:prepilin-type processing-associated H-X9-DG protein
MKPYYPLAWTNRSYHCPGYNGQITGDYSESWGSYGYNTIGTFVNFENPEVLAIGNSLGLGTGAWMTNGGLGFSLREAGALVPSDLLCFADCQLYDLPAPWPYSYGTTGTDRLSCGAISYLGQAGWLYPERHGKNYNVAFCDAHVEGIPPLVLYNPTNTAIRWNNDHQPHPETWYHN